MEEWEMRKVPSEEDLNWIVGFALEQTTVEDVLDIIYICWGYSCIVTIPPMRWEGWKSNKKMFKEDGEAWPSYVFKPNKHLRPIYRHAIRLINSQDDALLIYETEFLYCLHEDESLVSFLIALEFCDSSDNLEYLTSIVLERVNEPNDLFNHEEEILAIFEKKRELLEKEKE